MNNITFISLGEACDVKYQLEAKFKEHNKIQETYFFDWIVSDFWWYLYVNNIKIDILDEKTLLKIFKDYLNKESYSFFIRQRNIISNKNIKIRVLKYENFNENIKMIKEKLNFEDEKISIEKIRFKNLNIKKTIIIDKTDERKIIDDAKFFFNNYYSDTNIPSKYR